MKGLPHDPHYPHYPVYIQTKQNEKVGNTELYFRGKSAGETLSALIQAKIPTYNANTVEGKLLSTEVDKWVHIGGRFSISKREKHRDQQTREIIPEGVNIIFELPRYFGKDKYQRIDGTGETFTEALERALGMKKGEIAELEFADKLKKSVDPLVDKPDTCETYTAFYSSTPLKELVTHFDPNCVVEFLQQEIGDHPCDSLSKQLVQVSRAYVYERLISERPFHSFRTTLPVKISFESNTSK